MARITRHGRTARATCVLAILGAGVLLAVSCQRSQNPSVAVHQAPVPTSSPTSSAAPSALTDIKSFGFTFPAAPSESRGDEDLKAMNASCLACHKLEGGVAEFHSESDSMHTSGVHLACVDCHGGQGGREAHVPPGLQAGDANYLKFKRLAHVAPTKNPELWASSAHPQNSYTALLQESPDFVRFINPGDLRAARAACGACHAAQVNSVATSMMTHGSMLWGAALYNNGAMNRKPSVYGELYAPDGQPASVVARPLPTVAMARDQGILPALFPLPRWEITQPGNVLRVFERGGEFPPNLGVPEAEEGPGRPDVKLSVRGYGTNLRTDPVFIGLQKTRLFDPTLNLMGTNDHPGDYRSSGCTACHVVYANDRSPVHSAFWSEYGNRGQSYSNDRIVNPPPRGSGFPVTQPATQPAPPPRPSGHPVQHVFVRNMPTSSCIVCHVHPGTNVLNSYLGYMWWDNESDGWQMYPSKQVNPTSDQELAANTHNPEGAAAKGLWSDLYPNLTNHRGEVAGPDFLENLAPRLNPRLQHNQFADFHGHGWVFSAVFKQDRQGHLLDYANRQVDINPKTIADKMRQGVEFQQQPGGPTHPPDNVPVHLKDIHLEKGMQCVDCHFRIDAHGDGNLYGETRNAVAVDCADCHGTIDKQSAILDYLANQDDAAAFRAFSGNAATAGVDRATATARNKKIIDAHFELDLESGEPRLKQKSAMRKSADDLKLPEEQRKKMRDGWIVTQTVETAKADFKAPDDPTDRKRAISARYAHTIRRDNLHWGNAPAADETAAPMQLAHANTRMSCYACHSAWNTSCFGCHLPQRANERKPMLHNEGALTRNYTNYNYQTLRDDIYMLGVDSTVKGHRIVPVRSACAVVVSSQNANRDWVYSQQQTLSAEGYAGTAFSPNFPHTVRAQETKQCTDCHVSRNRDNNAITAQLLMQGTNAVNFIGRYAWIAEGSGGVEAVAVTERDEPQAVIGSRLHEMAYPDNFRKHLAAGGKLNEGYEHRGEVLDVQLRGEYLYAACGPEGFIAYDVANIDNKDFSERFSTAPVSLLGQRFSVPSQYATSICSPSTLALDPARSWTEEDRANHIPGWRLENEEGRITEIGDRSRVLEEHRKIHPLYGFLYLTDREEGLIVIGNPLGDKFTGPGVTTLLDGNPRNNFLSRALTFNPSGLLRGARHMDLYGTLAYISCDAGLVVLDLNDPLHPRHITTLTRYRHPRKIQFQFRYGFVIDDEGLKVLDVTLPSQPQPLDYTMVPIPDARDLYICRTYAYVAAGKNGLVIVDLTRPQSGWIAQKFDDAGRLNDATAVRVGMTNTSLFAYVADGRNGLKLVQLTSPDDTPTYAGYSPRPAPRVIAWRPTRGPAISLSEGLDRDRAVDESGNQLAVFGRRGARPFTLQEQRRLFFHNPPQTGDPAVGTFYDVADVPDFAFELRPKAVADSAK